MKLSKNSTLEKINKYKKVILGCIVTILVMLGLFVFLNQSYIQKFIYEERLNQMDEIIHQMFLNLEDVMGTKWDFLCERRWNIFMIFPLTKRKKS